MKSHNKIISALLLSSMFVAQVSAAPNEGYIAYGQRLAKNVVAYASERPLYTTIALVATAAAGTLTYLAFRQRVPQVAPAAVPFAAAAHAAANYFDGAPHHGAQPHHGHQGGQYFGTEQQMLDLAIRRSLQEGAPARALGLSPAEFDMNLSIILQLLKLETDEERVEYLQRVLYNHDHVFMERDALLAFVIHARGMQAADIVAAFQKLQAGKWSLLTLAPEAGQIDPEQVPAPDFDALRADFEQIRRIPAVGGTVDAAYASLLHRHRHAVEDAILRLIVRGIYFPQGLDSADLQRMHFALTHLFGTHGLPQVPSAPPPAEVPAAAAPVVLPPPSVDDDGEAPQRLSPDELRQARLKRFDEKKE